MDTRERVARTVGDHFWKGQSADNLADAILAIFAGEREAFQKASYDARIACENQRKRAEKAEAREAKLVAQLAHWREKAQRWALQSEKKDSNEAEFREALRGVLGTEEISTARLIAGNALASGKEEK